MTFETKIQYEGYGWAEFGKPVVRVGGPTIVTSDERGQTVATMKVQEIPTAASIEEGVIRLTEDAFQNFNRETPCKLVVNCPNGIFSSDQTFRNSNINLHEQSASIAFQCFRGSFESSSAPAVYWRLPIWNFHGDLRPPNRAPKVVHPLRLSEDNPASAFELFGEIGFVESVPDY